jgi:hypothetical protein
MGTTARSVWPTAVTLLGLDVLVTGAGAAPALVREFERELVLGGPRAPGSYDYDMVTALVSLEVAEVLGSLLRTVERKWRPARLARPRNGGTHGMASRAGRTRPPARAAGGLGECRRNQSPSSVTLVNTVRPSACSRAK